MKSGISNINNNLKYGDTVKICNYYIKEFNGKIGKIVAKIYLNKYLIEFDDVNGLNKNCLHNGRSTYDYYTKKLYRKSPKNKRFFYVDVLKKIEIIKDDYEEWDE